MVILCVYACATQKENVRRPHLSPLPSQTLTQIYPEYSWKIYKAMSGSIPTSWIFKETLNHKDQETFQATFQDEDLEKNAGLVCVSQMFWSLQST